MSAVLLHDFIEQRWLFDWASVTVYYEIRFRWMSCLYCERACPTGKQILITKRGKISVIWLICWLFYECDWQESLVLWVWSAYSASINRPLMCDSSLQHVFLQKDVISNSLKCCFSFCSFIFKGLGGIFTVKDMIWCVYKLNNEEVRCVVALGEWTLFRIESVCHLKFRIQQHGRLLHTSWWQLWIIFVGVLFIFLVCFSISLLCGWVDGYL